MDVGKSSLTLFSPAGFGKTEWPPRSARSWSSKLEVGGLILGFRNRLVHLEKKTCLATFLLFFSQNFYPGFLLFGTSYISDLKHAQFGFYLGCKKYLGSYGTLLG